MFDAELYLRLVGERSLAEGSNHHHHGPTPLSSAAQALVAAGVLERPTAQAVLMDYLLAAALRGDQMATYALHEDDDEEDEQPRPEPLEPARVVVCEREFETATGTVRIHLVSLTERETVLAATLRFASTPRRRRGGHTVMMYAGGGPGSVTLSDDRGTKRTAHFGGGGGEHEWTGYFGVEPGLAVDTAYIDFDGERIELVGAVPPAEVWIEDLAPVDPALRFLWGCLTQDRMHEETPLEPAIEALVAAGVLAPDHPELDDLRAVSAATHHGMMYGAPSRSARKLPEPWRSVFARGPRTGPAGTLAVNAVTPLFDGVSVAVTSLKSDEHGWELSVEMAPDRSHSPFGFTLEETTSLTWWARDERGHHFLGQIGSWSGGESRGRGEITFPSALDRKASYVDLLPTGATQRAVIRIPLEWPA